MKVDIVEWIGNFQLARYRTLSLSFLKSDYHKNMGVKTVVHAR